MSQLYDPIRKCWVKETPEERVRQFWIQQMVGPLGFPKEGLCVEKELNQLPHLKGQRIEAAARRADLICFASGIHPSLSLYPLLLLECKAYALTEDVIQQVVGYNHWVKAFFVAVANGEEIYTLWQDKTKKEYRKIPFLPSFDQLKKAVQGYTEVN